MESEERLGVKETAVETEVIAEHNLVLETSAVRRSKTAITRRIFDINELSNMTGLKVSRLRYLVHVRGIPFLKIGQSIRFDVNEIDYWLETLKVVTADELA
ncbi:helix-turn-helix domain-containing protein [Acidobacteriota bacterium]